ncbi:hypothetical protein BJ878DRAFT_430266 [Calycina marina]|uniref:LYR motif-containing protein 2 n=1 Tax=Calycina marina TaxID=1763456 RepID=A0A9P7YUZ2_9HELO|nr:hypothetical protein BJ878DRAFT_430266 [Calycina marina]
MIIRLLPIYRCYTTAARRPNYLGKTVDLDHFLQRKKAIALWRSIVRGCKKIEDKSTKQDTLKFAREEFRRNKDVEDITQIRYLTSTGKMEWETMEKYIEGL